MAHCTWCSCSHSNPEQHSSPVRRRQNKAKRSSNAHIWLVVLVLLHLGACPQQGDNQIFASSSYPLPFSLSPFTTRVKGVLTMGGYKQFTMRVWSTKSNAAHASLNVTFSSCCRFSSIILHLLHYEFLQITLWCILGALRITMGWSTLFAESSRREGKKSANIIHISVRESLWVTETFPPLRSRGLWGIKLTPCQCAVKLWSSSQWQEQASWKPSHCWPNFHCSCRPLAPRL